VVYGRDYGADELRFEASGGLMYAALIMQDKETDTYWSIMSGDALAGELKGTKLEELPVSVKTRWKEWLADHPDTVVLSVDGVEHLPVNPYEGYFESEEGYRGIKAEDDRLPTKAPVYAFKLGGKPYAVPYAAFEGGAAFDLGDRTIFLFRPRGAAIFESSVAFVTGGPLNDEGGEWRTGGGASFDVATEQFVGEGAEKVRRLDGFDTFWYSWSLTNPSTEVLGGS
jgi:hypothetical protein